jgi:hypothetical protein
MKTKPGRGAGKQTGTTPRPGARPPAGNGAAPDVFLPFGAAHTVALDLPEFAPLVAHLQLPAPSRLSPLPDLMAPGTRGKVRDVHQILGKLSRADPDTLSWIFTPLAIPDRILDLRGGAWNGAPQLCRLYSNRYFKDFFAGLRPALATDYELLAPFSTVDLTVWSGLLTQLSGGQSYPSPVEEPTGEDLAFLLLLADAHKAAYAATWMERREEIEPVLLTVADIMGAQAGAVSSRDRRWASRAIGELFAAMIHPGGRTGVALPELSAKSAAAMVDRYTKAGLLKPAGAARDARFELGTILAMWCGSLFSWLSLASLHDMQVIGVEGGRMKAQEECLVMITTQSAIWVIASDGLAAAGKDLAGVRFAIRSVSVPTASNLVARFVEALPGVTLPDEVYAPADGSPAVAAEAPEPAAASAPPAPPRRKPKAPVWTATHTIPEGGLDAWDEPDPDLEPVAQLEEGLDVQVTEEVGAWAHVVCDNGWEGWTDARELVAI